MSSELPIDEWVVIFYPQTGSTRLCPTLDVAREMVSESTAARHVYRKPGDFRQRHDHHALEKFWVSAYKNASHYLPKTATGNLDSHESEAPDVDTETLAKLFWQLLQDVGDRVRAPQIRVESGKKKDHYELKLLSMREFADSEEFKSTYNKQARTLFLALLDADKQFMTEDEIRKLVLGLVASRQLKTKQDPWVVFQYYRPQFIRDSFILRGGSDYVKQNKPR